MNILSQVATRVLGALVEKELTTPEYYPLSVNALVNACNQKSNRDPLMNLDENAVSQALRSLDKEGLAGPADAMDNRVTKFGHRLQEAFNFDRREIAILCELLLRGPQTPGELRSRAERMHHFDDLGQVQSTLQRLAQCEPPLVKMLPRQPGTKEPRYAHLLSGPAQTDAQTQAPHAAADAAPGKGPDKSTDAAREAAVTHSTPDRERINNDGKRISDGQRIARLENELAALQNEFADLKQQLAAFRKQFE